MNATATRHPEVLSLLMDAETRATRRRARAHRWSGRALVDAILNGEATMPAPEAPQANRCPRCQSLPGYCTDECLTARAGG